MLDKTNGYFGGIHVKGRCFEGACQIVWKAQNILTDAESDRWLAAIEATPEYKDTDPQMLDPKLRKSILGEWCIMLSCLISIEVERGKSPYADALDNWFKSVALDRTIDPGGYWLARYNMPFVILAGLREAWRQAQEPLNPPEKLPGTALTPEQVAELADPDSPLAAPAGNGGRDSAKRR